MQKNVENWPFVMSQRGTGTCPSLMLVTALLGEAVLFLPIPTYERSQIKNIGGGVEVGRL